MIQHVNHPVSPQFSTGDFLRQGAWFASLEPALQELILARTVPRNFPEGAYMIHEGDGSRGLYVLLDGWARFTKHVSESEEVLMHIGGAGTWFGDFGLFTGRAIGSVIADTPCRTLLLPMAEFERIVAEDPRHYRAFNQLLLSRLDLMYRFMAEARGLSAEDWLLARLRGLVEVRTRGEPAGDTASIPLSQAQISSLVGLTRQTLSGMLKSLVSRGLIEISYRRVRLLPKATEPRR